MSYSSYAGLIYGIPIPDELPWDKVEDVIDAQNLNYLSLGDSRSGFNKTYVGTFLLEGDDYEGTEVLPSHIQQDNTRAKDKIRKFCEELGIDFQEPRWYLGSYVS